MPNLKQLFNLREQYSGSNNLIKSFSNDLINESFELHKIASFNPRTVERPIRNLVSYFNNRVKVEVVLLYIDITSFSTKFQNYTNNSVVRLLDNYYDKVIPIVYKYGGEIEKIMGDGIICVFGEPFLSNTLNELLNKAKICSKEIISTLYGTYYESKVALHYGEVIYYNNPTDYYNEYTIVGKVLTELYRLESLAINNSVNYFCNTRFDNMINLSLLTNKILESNISVNRSKWYIYSKDIYSDIKEIEYKEFKYMKYIPVLKFKHLINRR